MDIDYCHIFVQKEKLCDWNGGSANILIKLGAQNSHICKNKGRDNTVRRKA